MEKNCVHGSQIRYRIALGVMDTATLLNYDITYCQKCTKLPGEHQIRVLALQTESLALGIETHGP